MDSPLLDLPLTFLALFGRACTFVTHRISAGTDRRRAKPQANSIFGRLVRTFSRPHGDLLSARNERPSAGDLDTRLALVISRCPFPR